MHNRLYNFLTCKNLVDRGAKKNFVDVGGLDLNFEPQHTRPIVFNISSLVKISEIEYVLLITLLRFHFI